MVLIKMHLLCLTLFLVLAQGQVDYVHEVIIIGAGTSGIAASKVLNQHHIDHIIIQSRNRIGGRIVSSELDGNQIDLGATFVHNPLHNNSIDALIKEMNWPTVPAKAGRIQEFTQNKHIVSQKEQKIYDKALDEMQVYISQFAKHEDIDLQSAWNVYFKKQKDRYSEQILRRLHFKLQMEALVNGADLDKISSRKYISNNQENFQDKIPVGGFQSLLKAIYNKCCKSTKIYFNECVNQIHYSGNVIKITTKYGVHFYSKKVIVSVPLGVLKKNLISFAPQLPSPYKTAIKSIGFGVFNKVIVSFENPFWKKGKKILNFVANQNRYIKYQECYVVSESPKSNLVMFLVGGSRSLDANKMKNQRLIKDQVGTLSNFVSQSIQVDNYTVTRWEQDQHSYGSYSYYKVGTSQHHINQLKTPIHHKLWFIGEHTHPKYSSNVHGAFDSGVQAANHVIQSLSYKGSFKEDKKREKISKIYAKIIKDMKKDDKNSKFKKQK